MASEDYVIYIDGSSKGNPGPSGIGLVIFNKNETNKPLEEITRFIGEATNNIAEYEALIWALKWLINNRIESATIKMDSALVFNQLTGNYRVKSPQMAGLYRRVKRLMSQVKNISLKLIPRDENKMANRLAQRATRKNKFKKQILIK